MKYAAVAGLSLMMAFSFNAVASDVYDCVYSKASLDNGKMGQMIGSEPARIEYDGSSFKAYRPSGVALISPKLNSKQGSVTLSKQVKELLLEIQDITGRFKLVFPGRNDSLKPMREASINQVIKRVGHRGKLDPEQPYFTVQRLRIAV